MRMQNKPNCVLYYGVAITDRVYKARKLATLNAPGTNRMSRLAQALQRPERKCFVLSPGIFPRIVTTWRVIPAVVERRSDICFVTLAQLGICWLGFLLAPLSAILAARRIARRYRIVQVVHYNFTPDGILLSLWCRIVYGSKPVVDLEDINLPRWSDFSLGSSSRPWHQLAYWCAMKISVRLAHSVIVPTSRFEVVIPKSKKMVVITGCQHVTSTSDDKIGVQNGGALRLLHSGGTNPLYGARILSQALAIADKMRLAAQLEIYVCGNDSGGWFRKSTVSLMNIKVRNLGFLSTEDFHRVLERVDCCFALQDPEGREGSYKTPSKGYEAICMGKALIVSDVGDFSVIPDDACYHLHEYTPEALAGLLSGLTKVDVNRRKENGLKYARENFSLSVVRKRLLDEDL